MRTPAFATIAVFWAIWAVAQQGYPEQPAKDSSSGQTTIQGCLSGSDGSYTLTGKSGTAYQLTGNTAKLSAHVGHEVQIKGTTVESGAAPGAPSASTRQMEQSRIDVSSVRHISETCGSKPKSETEKPPMSEKPPGPPQ